MKMWPYAKPESYTIQKILKDRTQPAIDLVNRLEGFAPNSILDLGCGHGNSTKVLKDEFSNAKIIGADNSAEMLEKARELYPDIEFIQLDANGDLHEINKKIWYRILNRLWKVCRWCAAKTPRADIRLPVAGFGL